VGVETLAVTAHMNTSHGLLACTRSRKACTTVSECNTCCTHQLRVRWSMRHQEQLGRCGPKHPGAWSCQ
jgi:hypothetical protein